MPEERGIPVLINTDLIPRTWKPVNSGSEHYEAACHPFLEIGYLSRVEYEKLLAHSEPDGDGWMTEVGP